MCGEAAAAPPSTPPFNPAQKVTGDRPCTAFRCRCGTMGALTASVAAGGLAALFLLLVLCCRVLHEASTSAAVLLHSQLAKDLPPKQALDEDPLGGTRGSLAAVSAGGLALLHGTDLLRDARRRTAPQERWDRPTKTRQLAQIHGKVDCSTTSCLSQLFATATRELTRSALKRSDCAFSLTSSASIVGFGLAKLYCFHLSSRRQTAPRAQTACAPTLSC